MPRKRSRIDIITDMLDNLQNSRGELKPTHLMYKSNLAHGQMISYLEELLEKELIRKIKKNNSDYIILTNKGFEFFGKLRQMREFEKAFGL